MASDLLAISSNLIAVGSNLLAMVSNLLATASKLSSGELRSGKRKHECFGRFAFGYSTLVD